MEKTAQARPVRSISSIVLSPCVPEAESQIDVPAGPHATDALGEKDVLGLQVAVDDSLLVSRGKAARDLKSDLDRTPDGHGRSADSRSEVLSFEQLADRIDGSAFVSKIVDREDVRVREGGDGSRLALEPSDSFGIESEPLGKDLDRNLPPQTGIRRAIDLAHPADSQWSNDFVGTQTRTRLQRHRSIHRVSRRFYADTLHACRSSSRSPFATCPPLASGLTSPCSPRSRSAVSRWESPPSSSRSRCSRVFRIRSATGSSGRLPTF
jgi:hypothetical protein